VSAQQPQADASRLETRSILELDDVSKTYVGAKKRSVRAVEGFSCEVRAGEFLSIVGPSGCGKTTLLKILAGLIPVTSGTVRVGGKTITEPIEDFGMVFQTPVLLPWRTALDNVLLPIEILGRPKRSYVERALELLEQVGLDGFVNAKPAELSGGMQQRVALCRALIHDPRILLMDEPFASVDEITRERLNDHLLDLWDSSGKTIIFITHNVTEAAYLSDRVIVMATRPGTVAGTVPIDVPRPRRSDMRFEPALVAHAKRIQDLLKVTQ
jgi:NitT/TauT family transport system ATP-binding protein